MQIKSGKQLTHDHFCLTLLMRLADAENRLGSTRSGLEVSNAETEMEKFQWIHKGL
jgi:hypothetical protein